MSDTGQSPIVDRQLNPIQCSQCATDFPLDSFPFLCPRCGGLFEFQAIPNSSIRGENIEKGVGISSYRSGFPLPSDAPFISLGEGNTPLISVEHPHNNVFVKCEQFNPTGSFKDRATAVLVSALAAAGVEKAVEDSSGNAGSSFAAYAARGGIEARIFIPSSASGPKREQIIAYGAEVVEVPGPRVEAARKALEAAERGAVYASHAYLPHGFSGIATMALEIFDELGRVPGAVVVPVGQGSLILGLKMGFQALHHLGESDNIPVMIGVQAQRCAPLYRHFRREEVDQRDIRGDTLAEGIRIASPLRIEAVLDAVRQSRGKIIAVSEKEIKEGRIALGRKGLYVEPTSAVVWSAIDRVGNELPNPIVAVLTGSGYKFRLE